MKKIISTLIILSLLMLVVACKDSSSTNTASSDTYSQTGSGNNNLNQNNDSAKTDSSETPGFYDEAFEELPSLIKNSQSTDVDTVTGATRSSEGLILAVEDALSQAAN